MLATIKEVGNMKQGFWIVPILFALVACSGGAKPDAAPVGKPVLRVSQAELDLHLKEKSPQVRPRYEIPEGRADLSREVSERRLLAALARDEGLENDPALARRMEDFLIDRLLEVAVDERFSDEIAASLYEQFKERFVTEKLHLRQILIRIGAAEGKSDPEVAARQRAQQLLVRLQKGEDFAKLAREHSQDEISAAKGGDLGTLTPARLPAPLPETVRTLKPGELSNVVQTPAGFHILQLLGEPQRTERTLEEVTPLLKTLFQDQVRQELLTEARGKFDVEVEAPPGRQ